MTTECPGYRSPRQDTHVGWGVVRTGNMMGKEWEAGWQPWLREL
jgi:hypothetical protein